MSHVEPAEAVLVVAEDATAEHLIAAAKGLNASVLAQLRRSTEDFWRLGDVLTRLHGRPGVMGRWRQVLKEIGINSTSANQAIRLREGTPLDKLAGYRNKTAALRALGILAEPAPARKEPPDRASKPARKPVREVPSADKPQIKVPASTPEAAGEDALAEVPIGEGITGRGAVGQLTAPTTPEPHDPLLVLTRIVGRLEYLIEQDIEFIPEVLVQIDRAARALDLLREKEAAHAAA